MGVITGRAQCFCCCCPLVVSALILHVPPYGFVSQNGNNGAQYVYTTKKCRLNLHKDTHTPSILLSAYALALHNSVAIIFRIKFSSV